MKKTLSLVLALSLFLAGTAPAKHVLGVHKQRVTSVPVTGLTFPAPTGQALDGTAFLWNPVTLARTPATYIFRVKYNSHNYYYTNFFYSNGFNGDFVDDDGYYGCHPYPGGGGGAPTGSRVWEVSAAFHDEQAGTVAYNTWYTQAVVVDGTSARPRITYYYDLGGGTSNVTYTYPSDWAQSGSPVLIFGDNPWTNTSSEAMDGTLRGLQIYSANLSLSDAQLEAANSSSNTPVTAAGIANVWYMNQNPTPSDITDKSGQGHHPSWLTANRPTLYTE